MGNLNLKGDNLMKRTFGLWALTTIIITAFSLTAFSAFGEETETIKDPVALVNGIKISKKEYEREINLQLQTASQQGRQIPEAMLPKIKADILNNLIDRELLYQESQKKNITVNAEEVNNQIKTIKDRFADQTEFEKTITEMGLSEADIKSEIEHNMAIRDLIDSQVINKIEISESETKAYYDNNPSLFKKPEQIKASHILIKVAPDATDMQKAQSRIEMAKVQQKVKDGQDFATLAKEYSQGPSAENGGDLGFFGRGQMVKPFEDAAFALKPGQVSEIVETRFGYHLIKVADKTPASTMAYADVKERLTQHLKSQKIDQGARAYIESLKKDAKIEKFI
jgi:peptidyl-prolyl cis-trans isomerase C